MNSYNTNTFRFQLKVFDERDENDCLFRISEAKIVGYFSVNGLTEYCSDASQLRYLYGQYVISDVEKSVEFDLNRNLDSAIKKQEFKTWDKLNHLFTWVGLNSSRLLPVSNPPFLTYRGNLTTIMCTPYEKQEDWTICAKVCDGIIYLNSFETDKKAKRIAEASNFEKTCQLWGYKFEQYMMTDNPSNRPDTNAVLNPNEELCCVFDRNFGGHRVIYGAEMDGIVSDEIIDVQNGQDSLSKVKFVELKTNRSIESYRNDVSFRKYKLLKWWCQSSVVGIKHIICGFRDDKGIIKMLKQYNVNELPNLGRAYWNKNVCLNFLHRFLNFVKRVIYENDCGKNDVWKFDYLPGRSIAASRVTDSGSRYVSDFKEVKLCEVKL